jgi:hypothetical protein
MDPLVPFIYNFDVIYFGGNITLTFLFFLHKNICTILLLFYLFFPLACVLDLGHF